MGSAALHPMEAALNLPDHQPREQRVEGAGEIWPKRHEELNSSRPGSPEEPESEKLCLC